MAWSDTEQMKTSFSVFFHCKDLMTQRQGALSKDDEKIFEETRRFPQKIGKSIQNTGRGSP